MSKVNIVIAGDFNGSTIAHDKKKGLYIISSSLFKKDVIKINQGTVDKYDLMQQTGHRGNEHYTVSIEFKDGKKCLCELDGSMYKNLISIFFVKESDNTATSLKKNNGKPSKRTVVISVVVVIIILGMLNGNSGKDNDSDISDTTSPNANISTNKDTVSDTEDTTGSNTKTTTNTEPELPDYIVTDLDKSIWEIVEKHSGLVISASTEDEAIYYDIICKNDEVTVNSILNAISNKIASLEEVQNYVFTFREKEKASNLVIADMTNNGTVTLSYTSPNYKSKRNEWIDMNFGFDDQCYALSATVQEFMDDPSSFEHVSSKRRDIVTEQDVVEVNQILAGKGSTTTVEIGDFYVEMVFSGKNAFNATVRNTAIGVVDYSQETVTLISVE